MALLNKSFIYLLFLDNFPSMRMNTYIVTCHEHSLAEVVLLIECIIYVFEEFRCIDTLLFFFHLFRKGCNFCDFLFAFLDEESHPDWFTLKGKNLLLEQIFTLKVDPAKF